MTQADWLILALKIACCYGFLSLTVWVIQYTRYTRWAAWHDPLGRTLMVKSLLIAGLLLVSILSLFLHLNRLTSEAAGWVDVALIGAVGPVMTWRILVWRKAHKHDG